MSFEWGQDSVPVNVVIPAKAGIQLWQDCIKVLSKRYALDSRVRGNDE